MDQAGTSWELVVISPEVQIVQRLAALLNVASQYRQRRFMAQLLSLVARLPRPWLSRHVLHKPPPWRAPSPTPFMTSPPAAQDQAPPWVAGSTTGTTNAKKYTAVQKSSATPTPPPETGALLGPSQPSASEVVWSSLLTSAGSPRGEAGGETKCNMHWLVSHMCMEYGDTQLLCGYLQECAKGPLAEFEPEQSVPLVESQLLLAG